ncbi:MAG: fibronectin type III domain-containing protein [Bacteroidales bacterium]|nr:fibronectin type III domain-containing protein [Bacteroidales bacterium]
MKTRHLPLLLLLALFVPWRATAQETVTIGNGTSTTGYAPLFGNYKSSYDQMIYTASQIQNAGLDAAGSITKIAFNSSSANTYARKVKIYMGHTSKTSFSSGSDFIAYNDLTLVYDYSATGNGLWSITTGWNEFELDTPFDYDGESNLVIAVHCGKIDNYSSSRFYYTAVTSYQVVYAYSDTNDPIPESFNPTTYSGSKSYTTSLPNLRMTIEVTSTPKPRNLAVSDITARTATVTWEAPTTGTPTGYQYQYMPEGGSWNTLATTTETSANLTNLTPDTDYTFRVMATYDEGNSNYAETNFTTLPSCLPPTTLTATNITTTQATLSWTPGDEESNWLLQYGTDNTFAANTYTEVEVNTDPETDLSPLDPGTEYYARVKAVCGPDDESRWCSTMSFVTDCVPFDIPIGGWSENFEDITGTTSGAVHIMPLCWKYINTTTDDNYKGYPTVYNYTAHLGTKCLRFHSVSGSDYDPQPQYAILPPMSNLAGKQVTLWARGLNANSTFKIGTMSDPTDENTFTAIAEQALTTSYVEYRYTIPASTTNTYLVIMIDAANANRTSNGVYIDDIVIPTCPVPTDLTYTNVSTNSATLSWTPGGEESNWVLEYSTEYDFTGATSVPVSGDATETLNSLTSGTVYYVRVKADCGDGDTSDWISTTFTTQCDFVTTFPWSENFDDYYSGEFYELCWVNEHISGNGSYNFRISTYASGSNETHTIYLNRMAVGTQTKLVLPAMDLPNANYQFVIDAYRSSADASYAAEGIKVYASTNGEIEGATELAFISLYYGATDNNHIPAEEASGWYTYELPIGVSGPCYIILYGESQNLGTFYMDNFVVKVIPTCPVPTALTVSAVTANSATLSWTSGGNENNWVLEYGTASDFTGATSVDVSDNATTTLEGLTSGATYYARVKADCGNDDTSEWSTSVSFTTECVAITVDAQHSWTEDFESYEGFGFDENGDMPYCWESYNTANNSTLPHVFTFSIPEWYVHQGSNALILTGGLSFVVLPEFTNPLDELQISFWMKAQMQNYGKFELGYITDEEVTDIYNQFIPLGYSYYTNIPTEMTQMNIYLDIIPADAKRLAFCWSSNNNYACFIDDVEVSLMPEGVSTCDSRPALGYMEDFNSYYAINNVLPICWNRINTSTDSPYCNYPSLTSSSEDNTLYFASYAQYNSNHITTYDPQPQYAILPPMSDLAGKQVTLLARCFYANSTFKIGTMSDPTDENTFTAFAEQALTTSYVEYRYTIPANTTNTYLVIMIDAADESRNGIDVYIDDISITNPPTSEMPIALSAGWNWWAPMVQITAEQLRSAISGIAIYSKESENNVVADDVNLEPGQMYKLQTDDAIENVSVTGILTTPVNSISAGTNWIGYTGETAVIATALNTLDITPSDGDKIISQDGGFAIYNGTAWEGTLTSLEQGKGYVYVRPSTE